MYHLRAIVPQSGRGPGEDVRLVSRAAQWAGVMVLAMGLLCAAPQRAEAALAASLEARNEIGFGRFILTFDRLRLPSYRKEVASGILLLSFDEPVEVVLDTLPKDLPNYIVIAKRDPDKRAFRLALRRSYQVNIMEAGNKLFVDLLPSDWSGMPPPLPQAVIRELARAAAEAEAKALKEAKQRAAAEGSYKLAIRLARHPTFTRVVFDWNKFVTASLSRQASRVTVKFGRKAPADLSRLRVNAPTFLRSAKRQALKDGMTIDLSIDDDVSVRGFREGNTYNVDLIGADAAAGAAVADVAEKVKQQTEGGEGRGAITLSAESTKAAPERTAAAAKAPNAGSVATETKSFDPSTLTADAFGDVGPGDSLLPVVKAARALAPPTPQKVARQQATAPSEGEASLTASERPAPAPKENVAKAKPKRAELADIAEPSGSDAAGAGGGQTPSEPRHVRVQSSEASLRLSFPFAKPVSSAVFRRGRTVWIVFDSDTKLDDAALRRAVGNRIVDVRHVRSGRMQYYRLKLSRPWLTYVSKNENAWLVRIGDMVIGKTQHLAMQRALRSDKRSLIRIKLDKPGRVHWLTDTDIGDRIAVTTAFGPPRAIAKPQDFVEFTALATSHGIAIRPHADDIAVRLRLDELLITRHKGLTISAGHAHQYVPGRKALSKRGRVGFLDFQKWRVAQPAQLSDRIHELQRAIALSAPEEKDGQRYALAQIYLANDLVAESLGVLTRMASDDPEVESDPAFNVLRGAALVLMRRSKEARKDLSVHALAHSPDAALWHGLADAQLKNWTGALRWFGEGVEALPSYRQDLQARFRLAAARSALETNQVDRAAKHLQRMPRPPLPPVLEAELHLLEGRYFDQIGREEESLEAFDKVRRSGVRPAVAEADLYTIALKLKSGRMAPKEALPALETLQLVWRGDDVELGAMRLLADIYVKQSRYRDAFDLMRNAVTAFPQSKLALQIQDDMKQVFEDLYLHGKSARMKPVEALSLYYDHRQLTPVGRLGDMMIRRLANRLISVDLLDRAAELLSHQVEKRLHGAARAQVATRLAMVHLMNRKPDLAVQTIRRTRQAGLPTDMLRSRNLLEARALSELGRAEAAIEILNTIEGADVERLKGDALWTAQQWQRAGEQFERILGSRWQKPGPMSKGERFDILRAAISYSLAGDQFALDRMRKKYYEHMVKTPDAQSFVIVTKPVRAKNVDFRKLAKEIAASDTLDAFMKEFRERYDKMPEPSKTSAAPGTPDAS